MAYNKISNEAFVRASQNGTLDSNEKWVDHLLSVHKILTGNELVDILVRTYGPDAQYGHIFSGTLATMETAGKLLTTPVTCKVTNGPGSGYYKNPAYTRATQPQNEYQHSLTKALPSAVRTFNKRAQAVGQDKVGVISEQTFKQLKHIQWCLANANYPTQQDGGADLQIVLKQIVL